MRNEVVPSSVVSVLLPKQIYSKEKENNMYKTFSMELAGRTLSVDIGRVGK